MNILEKLLDIILEFLNQRKEKKIEEQEIEAVQIEQQLEATEKVKKRKKKEIQKPKEDNFFND